MRRSIAHGVAIVSLFYCFLPASSSAQSQITGVVTDSSGGVLPGVTVEASSPALIEKVRTAVTDDVNIRKVFRVGRLQVEPGVDVYNLLNSNVVITQNQNFGSSLGRPERILQGRLMRLTAQIDF